MAQNTTYAYNIYGFDEGNRYKSWETVTREWRKHIEEHVTNETTAAKEEVETKLSETEERLNTKIDAQTAALEAYIDPTIKVINSHTSILNQILGKI